MPLISNHDPVSVDDPTHVLPARRGRSRFLVAECTIGRVLNPRRARPEPTMLSHLRFHRRGNSNPSSPLTDQQPASPFSSPATSIPPDAFSNQDVRPSSSGSSALPPTLPPITRVTSDETPLRVDTRSQPQPRRDADAMLQSDPRPQQPRSRSPYNVAAGFIGGVALQKYRRNMQTHAVSRPEVGDNVTATGLEPPTSQSYLVPDSSPTDSQSLRPPPQVLGTSRHVTSFSTPTELQNSAASSAAGRQPLGPRLHTDLPAMPATASIEPQKAKKSLPFLKNPMSTLLMRRKNGQNPPDGLPLAISGRPEEPVYDPRIKGTRVHDFSAPRRRDNVANGSLVSRSTSNLDLAAYQERKPAVVRDNRDNAGHLQRPPRHRSNASESDQSGSVSIASQYMTVSPSISSQRTKDSAAEQALSSPDSAPPVPPKDNSMISFAQNTSNISQTDYVDASLHRKTTKSSTGSRRSTSRDAPTSIPKHMKSTSSRFSFDMIGAAEEERLLEDRHRQREMGKQTTDHTGPRDSRFDDLDDDAFDYDAMMDDDGLEEKIPGVNADLEDEDDYNVVGEEDPDDDQENFSGFVFQRSDPSSSMTSPHTAEMISTPRDPEGQVIGFAMTKDSPHLQDPSLLSREQEKSSTQLKTESSASGLGIRQINSKPESTEAQPRSRIDGSGSATGVPSAAAQVDLYFDDGILGFEDELAEDVAVPPDPDGKPFDESLFDLDDTDKFGRPVPGAFAQAQAALRDANRVVKRESDVTSRLSAQSGASRSTAHTSLSLDTTMPRHVDDALISPPMSSAGEAAVPTTRPPRAGEVSATDYQTALALAAHKAAESGKFERDEPQPASASELPSAQPLTYSHLDDDPGVFGQSYYDDAEDDAFDDDAIIAEANASALENDADGWYGQEFGFYAPPSHNSNQLKPGDHDPVNGGVFLDGLNRSTSGRMISREPNLTPITERSEYSNRNSLMSLMPPLGPGTPTLQSPGLAQLATMAEVGDDDMSLSALLRLRTRAWGGSQASLASSKDGSPRSEKGDGGSAPWRASQGGVAGPSSGHVRKSSVYSTASRDSEPGSGSGSPTLTSGMLAMNLPSPVAVPTGTAGHDDAGMTPNDSYNPATFIISPQPQHLHANILPHTDMAESPLEAVPEGGPIDWASGQEAATASIQSRRSGTGHRHKGSADSISYMKEEDKGETRWVMERRRTGESGEVEILEREVVEGGRI